MAGNAVRAAVYCRISSDRDNDRLGVERQEADCRKLCADRGWEVVEPPYVDNDISAADVPGKRRRLVRPEFDRLRADIEAGRIDAVAVWDLDRLTRRPEELEAFVTLCERRQVTLEWLSGSVKPGGDGLLTARIKAAVAAEEVRKTTERLRRRKLQDAERGVPHGGSRAFGWENDGMTPRPDEAALVVEGIERVLRGDSVRSIRDEWRRRGIPTVSGGTWTISTVRRILLSPRNAGLRQHQGEVIGKAVWPAIIDRATWEKVRAILNDPGRRTNGVRETWKSYPLRGVLRCSECGRMLISLHRRRLHTDGTEAEFRFYICKPESGGCGRVRVNADQAEEVVFNKVLPLVDDPYTRSLAAGQSAAQREEIDTLLVANADDEAVIQRLSEDFYCPEPIIDRATFVRRTQALRRQIEQRQHQIAALRGHSALDRFKGSVTEHWTELTADEQRAIVQSLVRVVDVLPGARGKFDPGRLQVRWRWDELSRRAEEWEKHATPEDRVLAEGGPLLTETGEDTGLDLVIEPAADAEVVSLRRQRRRLPLVTTEAHRSVEP